jgi:NAD(P) transhydrogenase subunit beta
MSSFIAIIFIAVSVLFILGIKLLGSPKTARYGNLLAAFGMLVALAATIPLLGSGEETSLLKHGWSLNYTLMVVGIVIGLIVGAIGAYSVKMTAMPQMVALFNGVGGGAAALVASLEFLKRANSPEGITTFFAITMLFATLIGSLSFSGSLVAFSKLQGYSPDKTFSMVSSSPASSVCAFILPAGVRTPRCLSRCSFWRWCLAWQWSCPSAVRTCRSSSHC